MSQYLILCIDDERDVLDTVVNDLTPFESHFIIEAAESVSEAQALLEQNSELTLALTICDHIMPDYLGIDFLIELNKADKTRQSKKILLTGQAGLDDTVHAINYASLDFYIAKPWQKDALQQAVKAKLTDFIIEQDQNLMQWLTVLDAEKIMNAISQRRLSLSDN